MKSLIASVESRLWADVPIGKPDDCWEFRGRRNQDGYGLIRFAGGKVTTTHRLMRGLFDRAPVPDGLVVRHTCDNPPCCNPAHLLIGTHADNARDCTERGRRNPVSGPRVTHCKRGHEYTPENTYFSRGKRQCRSCQVEKMRRLRARQGATA